MSLVLLLVVSGLLTPPDPSGVVFATGGMLSPGVAVNSVYKIDLNARSALEIYTPSLSGESGTRTLSVVDLWHAPHSDKVVLLVVDSFSGFKATDLIDERGTPIKRIEGTISCVPVGAAGERIAYTKGAAEEDSPVHSDGTVILNLATNQEERICEGGYFLEWGDFDGNLYISASTEETGGWVYNVERKVLGASALGGVHFSPCGTYYWSYDTDAFVAIARADTKENLSAAMKIIETSRHGMPLYWMSDSIVMAPHYMKEAEDFLIFLGSGRTVKVPGRVLSVTNDERFVYFCTSTLSIEKVAISGLEIIDEGTRETATSGKEKDPVHE